MCVYVCVHVCMCMYVYMYVCMYVCMYACMYVCGGDGDSTPTIPAIFIFESRDSFEVRAEIITSYTFVVFSGEDIFSVEIGDAIK